MLLLTCLELSQIKGESLLWSEQITISFSNAISEFQKQLDGNRGIIFPAMFMSIAKIISSTAAQIHISSSETSMADAISQSWPLILRKQNRPKFIICIYEGPLKDFLIISTNHLMVNAIQRLIAPAERAAQTSASTAENLATFCKMVQSQLPQLSMIKHEDRSLPQATSVIVDPRNFQTYFTDAYSKEIIDTKLTGAVIEKTYQCFNLHFSQLENFKEFRQMFIIPDNGTTEAENQNLHNLPNSEVHQLSVFKQAISGIIEEILTTTSTVWLFCLLGGNSSAYTDDFYDILTPLADLPQTAIMMFSISPYELYCQDAPFVPDCNIVNTVTDVEELANFEYGIEARDQIFLVKNLEKHSCEIVLLE